MSEEYGYCQCGCGEKTPLVKWTNLGRGAVAGQPRRLLPGHNMLVGLGPEYLEDPDSGCWIWQRHLSGDGYGSTRVDGREVSAHRTFYERHKGPIPRGLTIDHLCRNRACVNPEHMEPVTHAENCARSAAATKTHCKHGHEFTEANTYRPPRGGRQCRKCASLRNRMAYQRKKAA